MTCLYQRLDCPMLYVRTLYYNLVAAGDSNILIANHEYATLIAVFVDFLYFIGVQVLFQDTGFLHICDLIIIDCKSIGRAYFGHFFDIVMMVN